jgi:hypothetical protein
MKQRRPIHEIRIAKVRAAIWANETENHEVWFNVSVARLYNDGNGWKDSTTFGRDDLPIVAKVMDMAYAWIWEQQSVRPTKESGRLNPEE